MTEWRPVVGYEGLYEVSNTGRVRSVARVVVYTHHRSGKPVRRAFPAVERVVGVHPSGHRQVTLSREGRVWTWTVHTLVLRAFVGPCPPGLEGLHDDGDPANNHVGNLSWGTRSENMLDRVRHGRHWQATRERCPREHLLVGANLVASSLPRRDCRSCSNAGRMRRACGHSDEWFRADADRRYRELGIEECAA